MIHGSSALAGGGGGDGSGDGGGSGGGAAGPSNDDTHTTGINEAADDSAGIGSAGGGSAGFMLPTPPSSHRGSGSASPPPKRPRLSPSPSTTASPAQPVVSTPVHRGGPSSSVPKSPAVGRASLPLAVPTPPGHATSPGLEVEEITVGVDTRHDVFEDNPDFALPDSERAETFYNTNPTVKKPSARKPRRKGGFAFSPKGY